MKGRNGRVRQGTARIPRLLPVADGVWQATMPISAPAENRLVAGRYRLTRVVGRGGMGVLWAAEDRTLGREVAVKEVRVPADLPADQSSSLRQRALREARAAARVTHPSAVTVYDVVEEDGRPWIVMELLSPRTLADLLAEQGPLSPAATARLGLDLLDALAAAHAAGVVHRDVKPGNVLFADGRAVLVDFGIATLEDDPTITASGLLLGSPAFMAPERARGEQPTPSSDLWSLGATLFAAVEGDPPFRREGHLPTLAALVTQDAPPARHAGPLRPVLAALLARDPADRPTVERARALLRAAAVDLPTPINPAPINPAPINPAPINPALIDHASISPAPIAPASTRWVDAAAIQAAAAVDTVESQLASPSRARATLLRFAPARPHRARALAAGMLAPVALLALTAGLPMPWQQASPPGSSATSSEGTAASAKRPEATASHRTPATTARSRTAASPAAGPAGQRTAPSAPTAVASRASAGKADKRGKDDGHDKSHDQAKDHRGHGGEKK